MTDHPMTNVTSAGENGWRDIASAPRDGTRVLLFARIVGTRPTPPPPLYDWRRFETESVVGEGYWAAGVWQFRQHVGDPTYWMPLPAPPKALA